MLRSLLAIYLLSAVYARVPLRPRELELGWPFGPPNGTIVTDKDTSVFWPYLRTFPDQCMLWDSSCSGNRTEALDEFFNNSGTMQQLVYGGWEYWEQHRKKSGIPPDMNSRIVSWMREPDCLSSFHEWHTEHPDQSIWTYTDREANADVIKTLDWNSVAITTATAGCCDACELVGGNVDVYFWPVPGANTDCVASIGTTAASDIDQNLLIPDDRGVGGGWWKSQPNPYLLTTSSSTSNPVPTHLLNARGHALLSAPGSGSESMVTTVQSGFTFTSPSIYVGFSSLYAVDRCGAIGTFIPYSMLAFAPGELSTIEWPTWDRGSIPLEATKSFNFADLPCPPQSVMIADQYKPAPGTPYRPVLSPPAQIYSLQPGWSDCVITHAFGGIDPPQPLMPAAALVPNPNPTSPQRRSAETTSTYPVKPVPGSAQTGGTGATRDPSPAPAHKIQTVGPSSTPSVSSPSSTTNDPHDPKNSFDPQNAQGVKISSQLKGWQAPISSEAASEVQFSSEKAKDSSTQDPPKDGSFTSLAESETSIRSLDAFHPSSISSDPKSDKDSTPSPHAVISDSPPTLREKYEEGTSKPLAATTSSPSPEDGLGQGRVSFTPNPLPSQGGSLPHESQHPQGTTTANAGSPLLAGETNSGISNENGNLPDQIKAGAERSSTRVIVDPLADPSSVAKNPLFGSSVGSSTLASLQSLTDNPTPNDHSKPQPQSSLNAPAALPSTPTAASNPFSEAEPDHASSANVTTSTSTPQPNPNPSNPATSTASRGLPNLPPNPSLHPPASTAVDPASSNLLSNTAPVTTTEHPNTSADPPAPLSAPGSAVRADANTVSDPPSNSIEVALGNQTVFASASGGMSRARASASVSKDAPVVPYRNGEGRVAVACLVTLCVCVASGVILVLG